MTHLIDVCVAFLWNLTIEATALLALTALAMACSRRLSASFRHYVWVSCLLALPFLTAPSLFVSAHPAAAPTARPSPSPAVPVTVPALSAAKDAAPAPLAAASAGPSPVHPWIAPPLRLLSAAFPDWRLSLCVLWVVGVLISLGRLAAGLMGTRALGSASFPIEDGPIAETAALLRLDTMRVAFRQALSPETAAVPMTWGVLRPVILFPADADTWPYDRLRAVLLHEAAHVTRQDWLRQTLVHVVRAVAWFHPFVWLAARACRAESERACDDLVLASGMDASDYARHLLDVARGASSRRMAGVVAMAQSTRMETRLKDILAPNRDRRPLTRGLWLAGFGVSVFLVGTAGVLAQATGLESQTVQAAPPSSPDTVAGTDAPQAVTLPNDVRVRVLGVTDDVWRNSGWWKADGSPAKLPQTKMTLYGSKGREYPIPHGMKQRVLAVQYEYDTASQPKWLVERNYTNYVMMVLHFLGRGGGLNCQPELAAKWEIDPSGGYYGVEGQGGDRHGTRIARLAYLTQVFPASTKTCTFKFAVAAEPDKFVTCKKVLGRTVANGSAGSAFFTLTANPYHLIDPHDIAREAASLRVTDSLPEDDDRTLLLLDRFGRTFWSPPEKKVNSGGQKIGHESLYYLSSAILARTAQFQLVDRHFTWASIPNVSLEPKRSASSTQTSSIAKTETRLSVTFQPLHGSATTIESTGLRREPNDAWTFTNVTLTHPDGSRVHAKTMTTTVKDLLTHYLKKQPKARQVQLKLGSASASATKTPIKATMKAVPTSVPVASQTKDKAPANDKTPTDTTTVTTEGPSFTFHTDSIKNRMLTDVTITKIGPTKTTYHSDGSVASTTTQGGAKTTLHCGTARRGPNGSWLLTDVTTTHPDGSQTHVDSMTVGGSGKSGLFGGDAFKTGGGASSSALSHGEGSGMMSHRRKPLP